MIKCKSRKSRDTRSNRQIWPWSTKWSMSRLTEFCQENALVIPNTLFQQHKRRLYTWTRWSTLKSDWLYSLQSKMEKLYKFSSVTHSSPTLCNPMNRSTPGLPVHHQLPEFTQTHVHQVTDAIQPSHLLSSPSPPAPSPSKHQSLFQLVNSSHEVAKVLEFQPQHQSFQWTPRTDLF